MSTDENGFFVSKYEDLLERVAERNEIERNLAEAAARLRHPSAHRPSPEAAAAMAKLKAMVAAAAADHKKWADKLRASQGKPPAPRTILYIKAAFMGMALMRAALETGLARIWRMEGPRQSGALWLELVPPVQIQR